MALVSQKLDVPLTGGLDEKTRTELVGPGSLLTAKNVRQVKTGSFQKSPGNTALGMLDLSGAPLPVLKRLVSYRDEVCATDNLRLYSDVQGLGQWKQATGYTPQLDISVTPTVPVQYRLATHAIVGVSGYQILVYTVAGDAAVIPTNYKVFASVLDAVGNVISPPIAVLNNFPTIPVIDVTFVDNVAVICGAVGGFADVYVTTLDTTSAATISAGWPPASILVSNLGTTYARFGLCSLGSTFALAYVNDQANIAGIWQVTVRTFNSALVQQAINGTINTGLGAVAEVTAVAISGDISDRLYVAYSLDTGRTLECVGLDPATLVLTDARAALTGAFGSDIQRISVLWVTAGTGIAVCTAGNDSGLPVDQVLGAARGFNSVFGIVPIFASAYPFWYTRIDSKLFVANGGRVYSTMRPVDADGQLLVIDWTATMADAAASAAGNTSWLRVVGNISPRLSAIPTYVLRNNPSTLSVKSNTNVLLACATKKNAFDASLDVATLDWSKTTIGQPAIMGENVAVGGAAPSYYDGVRSSEIGFFHRPHIEGNAVVAGGALNGTYKYILLYEQVDDRGQLHQSSPSDPFTCLPQPAGGQKVRLEVRDLMASNRPHEVMTYDSTQFVRIVAYRTVNGGNVYYRVPGIEVTSVANAITIIMPDDNITDAVLATNAPAYTQPGVPGVAQVKVTPPSFSSLIAHADRLVGANQKTVWFSGQTVEGEGYWFADLFQFTVETGGEITGLASMDGALIIFKRNAICYVDGQGPPDNGIGGDFSPPQFIATDVGCIEQRSIVVTPDGVMFQSLRGIELLTRGRQISSYMGRPVEAELAAYPVITSAVLLEADGRVVFTLAVAGESSTGISVEWDYVHHIWTTVDRSNGEFGGGIISSIMMGNNPGTVPVYTWLTPSGKVYQDTTSTYLTFNASYSQSVIETPWVHVGGVNGFQRVKKAIVQFSANTPSDVTMSLAFDYSASYTQAATFTAADIATWDFPQFEIHVGQQKCQAIRIKLSDGSPTGLSVGTGQGPTFIGLSLDIAIKPNLARVPIVQGA